MSYSQEQGYIPATIEELMSVVRVNVNAIHSTTYTDETFAGTGFYKHYYAVVQRMQENEIKTSEIFLKMQKYFEETNETILRPKVTPDGLVAAFAELDYVASVKPMIEANAGKKHVCVDVDDEAVNYETELKDFINDVIRQYTVGGVVTVGTEVSYLHLTTGQEVVYKFNLPDRVDVLLRLTLTISRNNQSTILSDAEIKAKLLENIAAKYNLGRDFEPETYFTVFDAPWTSDILLEYSVDAGANWLSAVYESEYDDLFQFELGNVTLIQS